jgi:hypothetical protein
VWRRARPCESHTHESYDPNEPCDPDESDESDESDDRNEPDQSNEPCESDESEQPITRAQVDGTTARYDCP